MCKLDKFVIIFIPYLVLKIAKNHLPLCCDISRRSLYATILLYIFFFFFFFFFRDHSDITMASLLQQVIQTYRLQFINQSFYYVKFSI